MDNVVEENADWLWFPFLARNEITILEGDPDLGKSYLMHIISKIMCDGGKLPVENAEDARRLPPAKVFYCDLENSPGITKRRLIDNGLRNMQNFAVMDDVLSITVEEDMKRLKEAVTEFGPTLVVFDTVNTYLGKADAYKGHEAQQAFIQFKEVAKAGNCAVVVLRHVTKASSKGGVKAMYRGQGSISMTGVARVVISMGRVPDEPNTRAFMTTKCNIGPKSGIKTFTIEGIPNEKGMPKHRSRFVWGDWIEGHSAEELMDTPAGKKGVDPVDACKAWLETELKKDEREEERLIRMGAGRSFDEDTMMKAKAALGIKTKKNDKKKVIWFLKS